jgi:uncharacterized membrane protein
MDPSHAYDSPDGGSVLRSPQAWFFWLVLVGAAAHLVYYYPQLPERVATHFGAGGRADAWSDRQGFLLTYGLAVGGLAVLFLGLALLLPRFPSGWTNIPNRDYWFAPERKAATVRCVSRELLMMGAATLLFLVAMFHLGMQASMAGHDRMGGGHWVALLGFLLYASAWAVRLMLRFRLPRR